MKKAITSPALLTFILTVGMLTVANVIKNMDIIFPEGAALALGCWVNQDRNWIRKPWHIVILPTVSSAIGVGLNLADMITVKEAKTHKKFQLSLF